MFYCTHKHENRKYRAEVYIILSLYENSQPELQNGNMPEYNFLLNLID